MLRFLKTQSINTLKTIYRIVNKINYMRNEHSTWPLHIPLHAIAGVFHPQPTPRQAIGKNSFILHSDGYRNSERTGYRNHDQSTNHDLSTKSELGNDCYVIIQLEARFFAIFTVMSLKCFLCVLAVSFAFTSSARPPLKKTIKKKAHPSFILLEAFSQHVLPVRTNVTPTTGEHFIIVWEAAKYPETFFWRGENEWLRCKIMNAHKVVCRSPDFPEGIDYTVSHIQGDDIHVGDTLELTPMLLENFPVPHDIPKDAKNTIFFKEGKSRWLSYAVKEITPKPDVTMP
jgi:hypothetical protein